jgi:tetratricopeptide (TPR) repeat protein
LKDDEIHQIEELISQTRFDEALQIVQHLEKEESLSPEDHLTCLLYKTQIFTGKGEFEKGFRLAENFFVKSQELGNPLREIDALIAQADALEKIGKYDESLKLINQCEQNLFTLRELPPIMLKKRKAEILYLKGRNTWQKNDPERAIIPLSESLTMFEELGNKHRIALGLRDIGTTYIKKGDIDRSIQYYEQSYQMSKEVGNKSAMSACLNNLGLIFRDNKNDPVKGLEYFLQSLKLEEELNDKSGIIFLLRNIGMTYHIMNELDQAEEAFQRAITLQKEIGSKERLAETLLLIGNSFFWILGDLDRGLDYFQKSSRIYDEIGEVRGLAWTFNNIGWIYKMKGELKLAIEFSNKCLSKHQEIDEPLARTWPLLNLAQVYHVMGDLEKANEFAKKTLALGTESGNEFTAAQTLYLMVNIALDSDHLKDAKEFSQQLQILYTEGHQSKKLRRGLVRPLKPIRQLTQLTKALILKTSSRLSDKAKAQEIFKEIAEEPVFSIEYTSTATLHLCDLLLYELKASGDESILQEAKKIVTRFREKAQTAHSYTSVVNALILQSKLLTVEGELTKAVQMLDQAAITAEEKGLTRLLEKATVESQQLEIQFDNWQRIIQSNLPFQKRLEQAQVEDYLLDALKMARLGGKSSPLND